MQRETEHTTWWNQGKCSISDVIQPNHARPAPCPLSSVPKRQFQFSWLNRVKYIICFPEGAVPPQHKWFLFSLKQDRLRSGRWKKQILEVFKQETDPSSRWRAAQNPASGRAWYFCSVSLQRSFVSTVLIMHEYLFLVLLLKVYNLRNMSFFLEIKI